MRVFASTKLGAKGGVANGIQAAGIFLEGVLGTNESRRGFVRGFFEGASSAVAGANTDGDAQVKLNAYLTSGDARVKALEENKHLFSPIGEEMPLPAAITLIGDDLIAKGVADMLKKLSDDKYLKAFITPAALRGLYMIWNRSEEHAKRIAHEFLQPPKTGVEKVIGEGDKLAAKIKEMFNKIFPPDPVASPPPPTRSPRTLFDMRNEPGKFVDKLKK